MIIKSSISLFIRQGQEKENTAIALFKNVKNVLQKIEHFPFDNSRVHSYHPVCETDVGHDRHMRAEFFRRRTGRQPSKFHGSNRGADAFVEESLYFRRAEDIKGSTEGIYCCNETRCLSMKSFFDPIESSYRKRVVLKVEIDRMRQASNRGQ